MNEAMKNLPALEDHIEDDPEKRKQKPAVLQEWDEPVLDYCEGLRTQITASLSGKDVTKCWLDDQERCESMACRNCAAL